MMSVGFPLPAMHHNEADPEMQIVAVQQVEDAAGGEQPHIGAAPVSGGLDERLF